jgi:exosortase A-associated hydrolase 2
VLWQPVISGSQYLTQFLRLRVASALAEGGGATVRAVREELERLGSVEIGGYELPLELAQAIDRARLDAVCPEITTPVHWLDVASDPARPLVAPAQQLVDDWRRAGVSVAVVRVRGDAFWATQEITEVPELVATTTRVLTMPAE